MQEQLILTNENRVFYSQKQIQDFLNGKADFVMENHFELLNLDHCNENQHDKLDHCSSQELKRLKVRFHFCYSSHKKLIFILIEKTGYITTGT